MNKTLKRVLRQYGIVATLGALGSCGMLGCQDDVNRVECGDVLCETGQVCYENSCIASSMLCGEKVCSDSQKCEDNVCVDKTPAGDPCADVTCESDSKCVEGKCVPNSSDPCKNVTCENGKCVNGECVSTDPCDAVNCKDGQRCVSGECYDDGCVKEDNSLVTCDDGKMCSNGQCVDDGCEDLDCGDAAVCVKGICREKACLEVTCDEGSSCKGGDCIENACLDVTCENGELCKGGDCIPEACKDVSCPSDKVCGPDGTCAYEVAPALVVALADNNNKTDEDGKVVTIMVSLNHQPAADVSVSCENSNDKEAAVTCENIIFNTDNWNQPQIISVTGLPDGKKDGDQDYTVSLKSTSEDDDFNSLENVVNLVNVDTTNSILLVNPLDELITSEDGTSVTIELVLAAKPESNVVFSVASSATTEGVVDTNQIIFTPENWDYPQQIVVTGVDDDEKDGSQEYQIVFGDIVSDDANFNGQSIEAITLVNQDNDKAGATIPAKKITVDEKGRTASLSIVLNTKPTKDVVISIVSSNEDEAVTDVESLVFSTEDWNKPQTVTVIGVVDNIIDGNQDFTLTFSFSSDDKDYAALEPVVVKGVNLDADQASINVYTDGTLTLSETGTEATFQISLSSIPTADVTLSLLSTDTTEMSIVSDMKLVFTADNWDQPQSVTVKGVDDKIIDNDQRASVHVSAQSTDKDYKKLDADVITYTIQDDDAAAFIIEGDAQALEEYNESEATFTVRLASQPQSTVTVNLTSSDTSELLVNSTNKLSFTSSNWNKPQTVTVKAVADGVADGNQSATVNLSATSSEKAFNGIKGVSPVYTIVDAEQASIVVTPASQVLYPGDAMKTFQVKLGSKPSGNVTVSFTSSASSVINVSQSLTFTESNYNTFQTVTPVLGTYEKSVDSYKITLKASGSGAYNSGKVTSVVDYKIYSFLKQDYAKTGAVQTVTLYPGQYKLQVWGAAGGDSVSNNQKVPSHGGLGGYSEGIISLPSKTTLYVQVGGTGAHGTQSHWDANGNGVGGGYNGGGASTTWQNSASNWGFGGGGATDIRINKDDLFARVIVAGGGGGADNAGGTMYGGDDGTGGYGGGETAGLGYYNGALGFASTHVVNFEKGYAFGIGEGARYANDEGAGGGGWFGGFKGDHNNAGGTGGSGFIYTSGTAKYTAQSYIGGTYLLNSSYYLKDAKTVAGNVPFESIGGGQETGHAGNGYARITIYE